MIFPIFLMFFTHFSLSPLLTLGSDAVLSLNGDVDWLGIQISQIAVIAMQCSMAILSVVLIVGIHTVS